MRKILGGILTAVVLATACSDDGGGDTAPVTTSITTTTPATTTSTTSTTVAPTTTEPPSKTVAALTDEEQIIAIVERFYEVVVEANNPPVLDDPIWDEVATLDFADGLRDLAPRSIGEREGARHPDPAPPAVVNPSALTIDDELAVLNMCLRDDSILYDLDTDEILNDEVLFFWKQIYFARTSDGWLVSDTNTIQEFTEEQPCVDAY
jgi:hypothetical protein